jgi:hypothetical protein
MCVIRLKTIPGVPAGANNSKKWDVGTYGKHQTKKKILVYQPGPTIAEFGRHQARNFPLVVVQLESCGNSKCLSIFEK